MNEDERAIAMEMFKETVKEIAHHVDKISLCHLYLKNHSKRIDELQREIEGAKQKTRAFIRRECELLKELVDDE